MVISGMIEKINLIFGQVLGHFVTGGTTTFTPAGDGEWGAMGYTLDMTAKGNALAGALADIVVYGMILVDFLVQTLTSKAGSVATG